MITTMNDYLIVVKKYILVILAALLIVSSGTAYYFYAQISQLKKDPQSEAQKEVKALIAKVGQLILLPAGEDPTIATVVDPARLSDQPFFVNAKKGDKVLIYTRARKAILYNPVDNKIVEVAPINIGNPAASPATSTRSR